MASVREIRDYFNKTVPFYMKLDFDNVGWLVGTGDTQVERAIVALDVTSEVIEEALDARAQLIVSHHPFIFSAIKRVTDEDPLGRSLIRMLRGGLSAICLHTNLDAAEGGVNDCLMAALGARVTGLLEVDGTHPDGTPYGIGRVGTLSAPADFFDFLARTKQRLHANGLRYVDGGKPVSRIACCGGSGGGDLLKAVETGCDTYVTADVKYDQFLMAKELGVNLIDADHFCTENVVVPQLRRMLSEGFPEIDVRVSSVHKQTICFF